MPAPKEPDLWETDEQKSRIILHGDRGLQELQSIERPWGEWPGEVGDGGSGKSRRASWRR